MINLMPVDMWLTAMPQDLHEDDHDEYERLIIDIPDGSNNADSSKTAKVKTSNETIDFRAHTEFPDKKATLVTEKIIANSSHMVTESCDSSLRINRDIPIKLLLKRRFQNSTSKPQKKYKTEDAKEHINGNGIRKLVDECKSNRLRESETTETITIVDDYNLIVSNPNENRTVIVSPKKYNSLNNSEVFESRQVSLSPAVHKNHINHTDENVNQIVSQQNFIELTTSVAAAEEQNTLIQFEEKIRKNLQSSHKNYLNQNEKQNTTCILVNNVVQKTSYSNSENKTVPHGTPVKLNNLNVPDKSKKEKLCFSHKPLQRLKIQCRPHVVIDTIDLTTVTPRDHVMKLTASAVIPENQVTVKQSNENNSNSKCPHIHNLSQVEQETTVITHSKQCNNDNNKKNTLDTQISSGKFRQTPQLKRKQRISVVSNEFLYQDCNSKRETLKRPGKNNQTQKKYERRFPQKYQEALIDFMESQYQLAIRENIPLTVNNQPLYQEPHRENDDTIFTEVIHVNPRQHFFSNFINPNTKQPRISKEETSNSAPEPGYNIHVHRGPDVNRIIITIANKSEDISQTTNCRSSNEDQRVPESTISKTHFQPSQSSNKKRSYFYKEPSLRTFRKRLCNRTDKEVRNRRFDSSNNNNNAAYAQHISYDKRNHDLPTPVIENYCYTCPPPGQNPVTNASCPWELYKTIPVQSDKNSRRTETPCSPSQFHVDSSQDHVLFRPLNLSLKPHQRPNPRYPVEGYY